MTFHAWVATGTVVAVVGFLALEVLTPEIVLLAAMSILLLTGVIDPEQAASGFGSGAVVTIAALLVVAAGIRSTGMLNAFARALLGPKYSRTSLLRMMLPAASLSAFFNNTPIVAILAPAVIAWCRRVGIAPSRMLMPLSYATILGGLCTLIGTASTLIVDQLLRDHGEPELTLFEIGGAAVPIAILGLTIMALFARFLLPDRADPVETLAEEKREYLVAIDVAESSPLVGKSVSDAGLRHLPGLFLVAIDRQGELLSAVSPEEVLQGADRLVFTGVASTVVDLQRFPGLKPATESSYDPERLMQSGRLFEAVVSSSSPLVGRTMKDLNFRSRYDAVVLAVHRAGHRLSAKVGEMVLRPGDTLMVEAEEQFDRRWAGTLDFSLISRMKTAPTNIRGGRRALTIVAILLVTVAFGWLDMLSAALAGATAMLVTRVLTVREAARSVSISLIVIIAGSLALGAALENSGAASIIAQAVITMTQSLSPRAAIAVASIMAVGLTAFIHNVAAVSVLFPIFASMASASGYELRPFAIALALGCGASVLTPTGYQTNLMVYGPGGYRFTDFFRLGAPLALVMVLVSILIIPELWPL